MAQRVPPELEQAVIKYQQVESQLASIIAQKSVITSEINEVERTLNILKSIPDEAPVYKNTGFVLVKVSRDEVIKELEERKEELEIRLNSFTKMEESLKKQLEDLRRRLEKFSSFTAGAGRAG